MQVKTLLEQLKIRNSKNERKFNGVYSRNNLPKIKDGTYVINLDEFKSIGTHWIALCDRYSIEEYQKIYNHA